jgi:hypothetical protein
VTKIFYWITLAIFAVGVVIFLLLIVVVFAGLFALLLALSAVCGVYIMHSRERSTAHWSL